MMCLKVKELGGGPRAPGSREKYLAQSRRASLADPASGPPPENCVGFISAEEWGVFVPWSHFQKVSHMPHTDSGPEEAHPGPGARRSSLGLPQSFLNVLCGLLRIPWL